MHGGLEDVMSLEFILQRGVAGVLQFSNILTISLYWFWKLLETSSLRRVIYIEYFRD